MKTYETISYLGTNCAVTVCHIIQNDLGKDVAYSKNEPKHLTQICNDLGQSILVKRRIKGLQKI